MLVIIIAALGILVVATVLIVTTKSKTNEIEPTKDGKPISAEDREITKSHSEAIKRKLDKYKN